VPDADAIQGLSPEQVVEIARGASTTNNCIVGSGRFVQAGLTADATGGDVIDAMLVNVAGQASNFLTGDITQALDGELPSDAVRFVASTGGAGLTALTVQANGGGGT
jgi:hypothetical protein